MIYARQLKSRMSDNPCQWWTNDRFWLYLGVTIILAYSAALLKLKATSLVFLGVACVELIAIYATASYILSLICISISVPVILLSESNMSWDVESFELQGYFDWVNGMRGAYWEYSKLPTMLYGETLTSGSLLRKSFYGFTVALLAASIAKLISKRDGAVKLYFFPLLVLYLVNVLNSLWTFGKGDLLTASFLIIFLSFMIDFVRSDRASKHFNIILSIVYSALAMASKMYALLYVACLFCMIALIDWRGLYLSLRRWNVVIVALFSYGICGFIYFFNLAVYGGLLDPSIVLLSYDRPIKDRIPDIISGAFRYPFHLPALALVLLLILALRHLTSRLRDPLEISVFSTLWLGVLMTPLTFLLGEDQTYNLRLIAFPIIAMLVLYA